MHVANFYRTGLIVLFVGGIIPVPAHALITFDEGHDKLFATGSLSLAYDSNIAENRFAQGDMIYSAGAGLEYERRAGIISVEASTGLSISRFDKTTSDDFSDPHLQAEFSAKDDLMTADLTLSGARESEPNLVAGLRAVSWNYAAGVSTKYRVNDRYSVSNSFNYTAQDFVTKSPFLNNLTSYSAGTNLYYTINSARDFFVGYNFGLQETGGGLSFYDHSVNVGIDGKILPKLNGTVSVGYEYQVPHGSSDPSTGSTTETVALTWNFSRRLKISWDLSQNFNTVATDSSGNTIATSLDAAFSMNSKTSLTGGVGGGYNRFIDGTEAGRHDLYFTWNAGVNYTINDHFTTSLMYVYYENWSTVGFSDFIRNTITLALNIRF